VGFHGIPANTLEELDLELASLRARMVEDTLRFARLLELHAYVTTVSLGLGRRATMVDVLAAARGSEDEGRVRELVTLLRRHEPA
jgi:hypothetical protein